VSGNERTSHAWSSLCCSTLFLLLGQAAPAQVSAGGIQIKMTPLTQRYCHLIQFPRGWEFSGLVRPGDGPINFDDDADYEFRTDPRQGSHFLIGASITAASGRSKTTNWYSADFANPQPAARSVSREAWEAAALAPLTRRSTFSKFDDLEQDRAEFHGHLLARSGAHWFGPLELVSRISPDSGWLALQSWTEVDGKQGMTIFVDVFDVGGKKVMTIEGSYSGRDYPRAYLGQTAWLTERYFIMPLGERRERCLICEFGARDR
jgi:hypothetical protein